MQNNRRLSAPSEFFGPWMSNSLGLDNIFDSLNQYDTPNQKYPPYNIIKGKDLYMLEFALSGWRMEELYIVHEKNVLTVEGTKTEKPYDMEDVEILHKGIADRSFTNKFTLGDNVEVVSADLTDGLLLIYMNVIVPNEDKPKEIPITNNQLLLEE